MFIVINYVSSNYQSIDTKRLLEWCVAVTSGQILESKELSERLIGIMKEIEAIAQKIDVNLPDNIVEESFNKGNIERESIL